MFALPLWVVNGVLANSDCGDHCVPSMPPEHTVAIRPLTIVVAFAVFGFLPLALYLLVTLGRRGRSKQELPTQSDHPNELW